MKINYYNMIRLVVLGIFLQLSLIATAKHKVYKYELTKVTKNSSFSVIDFDYQPNNQTVTKRENRVLLQLTKIPAHDYSAKIDISVSYFDLNLKVTKEETATLNVSYKTGNTYKELDVYSFNAPCSSFTVTVKKVSVIENTVSINPVIELKGEIQLERYLDFNSQNDIPNSVSSNYITGSNELEVNWIDVKSAEEYDLEWTWIDNLKSDGTSYTSVSELGLTTDPFKINSTRVSVTSTSYKIPVIYERGFILWRVRAIGTHSSDRKLFKYGDWNIKFNSSSSWYNSNGVSQAYSIVQGNEEGINWQYSAQYAEEGKRKSTISYFDGSLRNRQTQTKLNSQNESVATETIYDSQGRPAIQVAPAPTGQATIGFQPKLSLDTLGQPYSISDFDFNADGEKCSSKAMSMSNTSGAAKYYSNNNNINYSYHKFIPDAKGYPFSQVEYAPDNTGRVKSQGGIGADHQLTTGHETKYLYSTPSQNELYRLFGSEVGYEKHYKKNTVIDAIGQASVTYVDMQGKTIATALAGLSKKGLENLPKDSIKEVDTYIDNNTPQTIDGLTKKYYKEISIPESDILTFDYKVKPSQYKAVCPNDTGNKQLFDCIIETSFMVTNECGDQFLLNSEGKLFNSVIGDSILTILKDKSKSYEYPTKFPSQQIIINKQKTSLMPVGTYSITKVLTVNADAIELYLNKYISDSLKCLTKFEAFLKPEIDSIDNKCKITLCEQCLERFDYNSYRAKYLEENSDFDYMTQDEYDIYKTKQCDAYCKSSQPSCEQSLASMIADVSPMGQYGELGFDSSGEVISDFDKNPVSVFTDKSSLPLSFVKKIGDGLWKHPCHYEINSSYISNPIEANSSGKGFYYNNQGVKDSVLVYWDGHVFNPPLINTVIGDTNKPSGYYKIPPEQLKNLSDFIERWPADGSWAKSLIVYHPEFKNLKLCTDLEKSSDFDSRILSYTKFKDIISSEDSMFLNSPMLVDPIFNILGNTIASPLNSGLIKYVANGTDSLSIWQLAYLTTMCPNCTNSAPCGEWCLNNKDFADFKALIRNDLANRDAIWLNYQSMYLSLKRTQIENYNIKKSFSLFAYNGCIGDSMFSSNKNQFSSISYANLGNKEYYYWEKPSHSPSKFIKSIKKPNLFNLLTNEFKDKRQVCNEKTFSYYSKKAQRFPRLTETTGIKANDLSVCYEPPVVNEFDTAITEKLTPVNCDKKNNLIISEIQKKVAVGFLDNCGECPITQEFASLLRSVFNKMRVKNDYSSSIQLSCYPIGLAEYTTNIQKAALLNTQKIHFWQKQNSVSDTVFKVKISDGAGSECNITLKMKDSYMVSDSNVKVSKHFKFTDTLDFCCMEYLDSATILTAEEFSQAKHKRFKIGAWVRFKQSNGVVKNERIDLEGYSDNIVIDNCDFTMCNNTPLMAELETFMNELCAPNLDENGDRDNLLIKPSIDFSASVNTYLYSAISNNIKNCGAFSKDTISNEWQFRSSSSIIDQKNVLDMFIEKKNNGGVLHFRIMLEDQSASFSSIEEVQYYQENETVSIPTIDHSNTKVNPTKNVVLSATGYFGSNPTPQKINLYLELVSPDIKLNECTLYGYKLKEKLK